MGKDKYFTSREQRRTEFWPQRKPFCNNTGLKDGSTINETLL
jgi:hypothetical protein